MTGETGMYTQTRTQLTYYTCRPISFHKQIHTLPSFTKLGKRLNPCVSIRLVIWSAKSGAASRNTM
eukprot:COSAG01_NODE_1983_length_8729_cov_2.848801_2_plen_66_part_00